MNDLSHTIGRDPMMDRAIARVAQNLYEFERTRGRNVAIGEELETAARGLWGALARAGGDPDLRDSVRAFVVSCKEAERLLHCGDDVPIEAIHLEFARVVRSYRWFVLSEQAVRYQEFISIGRGHS